MSMQARTKMHERLVEMIETSGPLSIADYMAHCLFDPKHGYYKSREPFGASGDFITAPEISQMFGELIAAWLLGAAQQLLPSGPILLAEIGPGRGTLMKDMLRTIVQIAPQMADRMQVAMIETSPRLVEIQKATLGASGFAISWHDNPQSLPDLPLLIVGNEIFDALPLRQYVKLGTEWRERMVALDDQHDLIFAAGAGSVDPSLLPPDAAHAPDGAIIELAPARMALMQQIAEKLRANGGAGLFFDYGYLKPAIGDSFQALRNHHFEHVLESPGIADLTSHVDFAALALTAQIAGLSHQTMTQGAFLLGMGLLQRAGSLGSGKSPEEQDAIAAQVERLAGPEQMGDLFKVLAIGPQGTAIAPFSITPKQA